MGVVELLCLVSITEQTYIYICSSLAIHVFVQLIVVDFARQEPASWCLQHNSLFVLRKSKKTLAMNNSVSVSRITCILKHLQCYNKIVESLTDKIWCNTSTVHMYEYIENHNSLGCKQPSGLDVKQSPNAQDVFRPIPGLISCAGVTGSVGITRHARATQMAMYM